MSRKLERIFEENIRLDQKEANKYETVLRLILTELVCIMKASSTTFCDLFDELYLGGSFFDGLKVASTMQEFDVNIIFKMSDNPTVSIADLGRDEEKPNFTSLQISSWFGLSESVKEVCFQKSGESNFYLSPQKMFSLLHDAASAALVEVGESISIDGKKYRLE